MFKLTTKFDIDLLPYSAILNAMATQYIYSFNGVYHPDWLVQWSRHCSHMHIPIHSPWLPGYMDVAQTILLILKVVGLFPDRPYISGKLLTFKTYEELTQLSNKDNNNKNNL